MAVLRWNADKQRRHVNCLAALRAVKVTIHESRFTEVERQCRDFDNVCSFHEEKQTDVGIAVKMVSDALQGAADRMVLLTADSDQIPTAKFIGGHPELFLGIEVARRHQATCVTRARAAWLAGSCPY